MIAYAEEIGLDVVAGVDPRQPKKKETAEIPEKTTRLYPLNLVDALMNCNTFRDSRQITDADIPTDFDERLRKAASTIKDERAYYLLLARYKDGCTLQIIADRENLSRKRIRQLLEKYIKRLRHPDILRFLDCGIENIPEKTSKAMLERLQ